MKESYRFQIIRKYLVGTIQRPEASKLLQISKRQMCRLAKKIKLKGIFGVKHGNVGKEPPIKYPKAVRTLVLKLLQEKYFDFNLKHFSEILNNEFKIPVSHQTIWLWAKQTGLIPKKRKRRKIKRVYRDRMPQEGLLLQMDGSHHIWNGKDEWCLISAIDDATSEIPYAEFFKGETTIGCLKVLKGIIEMKGVPKAIYTDRAGWSGGGKRQDFSQFQTACQKLGIQIIYADSPEAKGRIERSFRTFQDRLIPELRSNKIKTMDKANQYLQNSFLKNYWNKEKLVKPLNPVPAYSPLVPFKNLDHILVIETRRVINSDHTVQWAGERYKLESGRYSYAGYEAVFREGLDGGLKVFVMENEVGLQKIKEPLRIAEHSEDKDNKPLSPDDLALERVLLHQMKPIITRIRNRVIRHMITGKPLNLRNLKKEVA